VTTFQISSPVREFTGDVGSVHFTAGRALADEAEHAAELAYFRASGYAVEPAPVPQDTAQAPTEAHEPATAEPAAQTVPESGDQSTSKKGAAA
jgi:hypothetical protein